MVRCLKTALLAAALALPCVATVRALAEDAKPECKECDKDGKKCDKKHEKCDKGGFVVSIEGMHCAACSAKVKKALAGIEGVKKVEVCHKSGKACVVLADEKGTLSKEAAEKALADLKDFKVTVVEKCEAGKCGKGECKEGKKEEKKD